MVDISYCMEQAVRSNGQQQQGKKAVHRRSLDVVRNLTRVLMEY